MINNQLSIVFQGEGELWRLTGTTSLWSTDCNTLLIREDWKNLRALILDSTKLMILKGKSGRGKTVFLLYLIFFILKDSSKGKNATILYVNRYGVAHIVTVESVKIVDIATATATHKPNYYFSDNTDIKNDNFSNMITLAATSGDQTVLKEFRKRITEAHGFILYMPSLALSEMSTLYPDDPVDVREFKFDVIAGNPRMYSSSFVLNRQ